MSEEPFTPSREERRARLRAARLYLLVTEAGAPDRMLRNNRDKTLTEIALGASTDSRGAITFDYDQDQDPDQGQYQD